MERNVRSSCLIVTCIVATGACLYLLRRDDASSPDGAMPDAVHARAASSEPRRAGFEALSLEQPAAMRDASEYAATRLREIKRSPARWTDSLVWQREFAAADTAELQREVLALAKQIGDTALLAILDQALASADYLVRLDAARSIGWLHEEHLAEGIARGATAADPDMRGEVIAIAQNAPARCLPDILRGTLNSPFEDVQLESVAMISDRPSHALFALLIDRFQHSDGGVHDAINAAIESITRQHFASSRDAATWWAGNAARFDELMLSKEE